MNIVYKGPQYFEQRLQEMYNQLSQDFSRDNPQITIGNPRLVGLEWKDKEFGYSNQDEFDEQVQSIIQKMELLKATLQGQKGNKLQKTKNRLEKLSRDLNRYRFPTHQPSTGEAYPIAHYAAYVESKDSVYLDAWVTYMYFFNQRARHFNNRSVNLPLDLRHELVHFELGDLIHHKELRSAYGAYTDKSHFYLQRQQDPKKREKDITTLNDHEWQEMESLRDTYNDKRLKCQQLGVDIAEEAVAHNYNYNLEGFNCQLAVQDVDGQAKQAFLKFYQTVTYKLAMIGSKEFLKRFKEVMNISWADEVHVLEAWKMRHS